MADDGSGQIQGPWPMPKFSFLVQWDNSKARFHEVSGLDMETPPPDFRAGNGPGFSVTRMPGLRKFGNITMKKGVFANDNAFFDWFNQIRMNTITRKSLTISLLDESDAPAMVWKVANAFPVKVSGTDLKAEGNEVAIDEIEIAHEGITVENP